MTTPIVETLADLELQLERHGVALVGTSLGRQLLTAASDNEGLRALLQHLSAELLAAKTDRISLTVELQRERIERTGR